MKTLSKVSSNRLETIKNSADGAELAAAASLAPMAILVFLRFANTPLTWDWLSGSKKILSSELEEVLKQKAALQIGQIDVVRGVQGCTMLIGSLAYFSSIVA